MATIDDMLIVIDAQTERMRRELRKADGQVTRFERRTNKRLAVVDKGFAGLGRSVAVLTRNLGLLTGVGLAGGIAGLGGMTDAALQNADALEDTAEKLGLSVERLQELRFAATETGVPIGTLDMALQRFTRRLGEAAQGKGELVGVLEQYNIQVRDARGRTRETTEVLGDLAEAVRGAESQQEALRIAFKAFDSEGAALVTLLREGRAGIDKFAEQARQLGIVLDRETVESLAETRKELDRLNEQIRVNQARIAANITPITEWGTAFAANVTGKIREAIEWFQRLRPELARDYEARFGALPPGSLLGDPQRSNRAGKADRLDLTDRVEGQTAAIGKWTTTVKRAGDAADDFADRTKRMGRVGESVAGNLDRSFAEFQRTGEANMRGFVDSAIQDLTRLFVRQAILQPLIGAATGGLGFGIPMGPGRQGGGPVSPGRAFPVGERGPELFVPRVAGQIVPAGGGGGLHVTVINNANARVQTRQTRQANGGRGLEVVVDEITAGNVRRAGSASALALQQAGARPPLVQR